MKKILSILITFIVLSAQAQDTLVTIKGVKRAASTVGLNYINLTNPSAITFPRMNADNSITSRTAAELLSDIGAWGISGNTGTGGTGKLGTTDNQPFSFYTNNTSRGSISAAGVFSITKDASISTVFIGQGNNSVTGNVKVGTSNTLSLISTGNVNTVVGYDAGTKLTTGSQNVFMGYQAGEKDTIGNANVAIGVQAGQNNNATRNTFIGPAAGVNCLSCTGVIMLENGAIIGNGISTGYDNIIIGNGFTGMSPSLHHTIDIGHKFISDSSEKIYLNHNGNQASLTGTDSLMAQTSDNKVIKVPVSAVSGGSGTPGGSNTQLQYNNSSAFGGMSRVTTNGNDLIFTSQSPTYTAGKLTFDSDNDALTFYNSDNNVALQIGQEEWIRVKNVTGSTIANGAVVYLSGANSGLPTIALAQSNAGTTTVGIGLATESIANNATGFVTTAGVVRGLNTAGFTAGLAVYIDPSTPGALTQTAPTAPNYRYRVGIVAVSDATVGSIHVTPSTASLGNGTANQVFGMNNAGTSQEVKTLNGTTNRVSVTNAANSFTFDVGSLVAVKDANNDLSANDFLQGYTTTATAAGTTTLTVASTPLQYFTGSSTQTVTLAVTSTLVLGQTFTIVNNSTGLVTVNSSGANNVIILAGGTSATLTCILTSGTTAASWNVLYEGQSIATGKKLTVSNTQTFAGTDGQTMTLPAASTTLGGLGTTQTWTGANTFNNANVLAGAATMAIFNTTATSVTAFGAANTLTIGGTATATRTHSYSTGATIGGATLNVNFATGGAVSSTTNINFGSNISTTTVDMKGTLQIAHLAGNTSAPSIASGTGAGTGPTLTVGAGSTDLSGFLNITTGTSPTLSATVATITFNAAYIAAPKCIMLTPANAATAALSGAGAIYVEQSTISSTTFTLVAGSTAAPASTALRFFYHVIQ